VSVARGLACLFQFWWNGCGFQMTLAATLLQSERVSIRAKACLFGADNYRTIAFPFAL
jgi:hypothetical protein